MFQVGQITLTLVGDLGDIHFTIQQEFNTTPEKESVDRAVKDILTRGAETLLDMYNNELGGTPDR